MRIDNVRIKTCEVVEIKETSERNQSKQTEKYTPNGVGGVIL